ncbi:MAG: DUF4118 domain-containing protein [Candidatus Binataceae bacterium]
MSGNPVGKSSISSAVRQPAAETGRFVARLSISASEIEITPQMVKAVLWVTTYVTLLILFWPADSWAYIDPNAGGVIWQIAAPLAASLVASLLYFRGLLTKGLKIAARRTFALKSGYLFAMASVGGATALNFFLSHLAIHGTFLVFMTAIVAICSWVGTGPAILAIGLSTLSSAYLFLRPAFSLTISSPGDRARLTIFVICALISVISIQRVKGSPRSVA